MPSKSFLKSHQSLQTHLCAFLCVYITSRDHAFHSPTSQWCPVAEVEILRSEILQVPRIIFTNLYIFFKIHLKNPIYSICLFTDVHVEVKYL